MRASLPIGAAVAWLAAARIAAAAGPAPDPAPTVDAPPTDATKAAVAEPPTPDRGYTSATEVGAGAGTEPEVVRPIEPEPVSAATKPAATSTPAPAVKKRRNLRIPRIGPVQPWVRLTVFNEWYRENYNTFQSDDGMVTLVSRINAGADARLEKVTIGTQVRIDGQKIWFPAGQDCSGDCVNVDDDIRLERTTFRVDSKYVTAIAGDYNVNFGRGLGLSVRKIDEIGVDATIKGGRFGLRTKPVRATAIAGFANRQNSDFATRQLIPDPGYPAQSYTFSQDTENRGCNIPDALDPEIGNPIWSVCSDLVAGGRVEGTLPGKVDIGAHYVYLDFGDEITQGTDEFLHMIGADVGRARIAKVWDLYLGGTGVIRNPNLRGTDLEPLSYEGYGLYGSNTFYKGGLTVLIEGKHYRDYLVALSQSSLLQYTENPTLEREDQQVPGNVNASGGRVRVDYTWRSVGMTLFGNSLNYAYSEDLGFSQFGDDSRFATHNYAGIIWRKPKSDFVLQLSGGYRHEQYVQDQPGQPTKLKRRFPHAEFSLSIPVGRTGDLTHALTVRGEGRFERYNAASSDDFFRGLFVFGYSLSPWFSISYIQGVDTERAAPPGEPSLTNEECLPGQGSTCRPHIWPGVQVKVNFFNSSFWRIFAGRQVGGRICVNGACRTVPDFEGIRSELVFSF